MAAAAPTVEPITTTHEVVEPALPWLVFLWDDPVNLREFVTHVLQQVFGYGREKAEQLMLEADDDGKTVVFNGPQETCELHMTQLHGFGLNATIAQDT